MAFKGKDQLLKRGGAFVGIGSNLGCVRLFLANVTSLRYSGVRAFSRSRVVVVVIYGDARL